MSILKLNKAFRTKHPNYTAPVIHLEFLENDDELAIAMQIVDTLEYSGIAFAVVFYNEITDEINLHCYSMSRNESKEIYREVRKIKALKGYRIKLN
jgi:hypothetical protein